MHVIHCMDINSTQQINGKQLYMTNLINPRFPLNILYVLRNYCFKICIQHLQVDNYNRFHLYVIFYVVQLYFSKHSVHEVVIKISSKGFHIYPLHIS